MPQANGWITTSNTLDSDDYNPLDHLNLIFSQPATLSSAPLVSNALKEYQYGLDDSIADLVAKQAASDSGSVERMQAAKAELATLFQKIESVRQRALQTEQAITEMTADIKRLDNTKRNLTISMTALKRLQMLTTAYEQLRGLGKSRQYKECAQLLQAVIQLMAHFKSYRSIDQIANLGRKVADLQRELLEQVCEDFEVAFAKGEIGVKRTILAEACQVVDALGENARNRLVTWFCNTSLREYRQIFRGNDEAGSLDNISRRYAWFNRMLKTYDVEQRPIFPPHWRVNEMLANAFCAGTRDDFKDILQRVSKRPDGQRLDVNLLLSCLQETLDFEHSLERKFAMDSRPSVDTIVSGDEKPHGFEQAISEAFEPYLSLWVEAQDKHLSNLIPEYRQQLLRNSDEEFSSQLVIPSSTELFQFYRLTLSQCAKLSTGNRLLELSHIFGKFLDQYSQQVLFYFLGDRSGPQGPSIEDVIIILNTADYCYITCTQLEEKIKLRIDEEYKSSVDLQNQADAFMGIAGAAVRALVRKVELDCEPSWREMRNIAWSKLENVGDQSSYVGELLKHVKARAEEILKLLHKRQYARTFCDNLVDTLTNTYVTNVIHCRPISEVGAEQMLLDFYNLKKAFTDLPTLSPGHPKPQSAYAKRVTHTTSKVDPLLKTLQVRATPPEGLVQAYLIHIADRSDANFRKMLDLKGVTKKQDQAQLLELFHAHRDSPTHANHLVATSSLLTPLHVQGGAAAAGGGGGAGPTGTGASTPFGGVAATMSSQSLVGGAFGAALLSAARDGVDRFGAQQSGGTSAAPSRVGSPPGRGSLDVQVQVQGRREHATAASVNDNLKSIGKFFRRDLGGLGRFGGGGGAKGEGGGGGGGGWGG